MLRRNLALGLLLVSLAPVGCAAGLPEAAPPVDAPYAPPADAAKGGAVAAPPGQVPAAPAIPGPGAAKGKEVASDKTVEQADRAELIIYTGNLSLLVDQPEFGKTLDSAIDTVAGMGGYVAKQDNQSVTVRVPSARFRDAMRELEKLGEVQSRNVEAQDVTEEAHDLEVRLTSLKATRKRLEEFLQRAANIAEVLQVEGELARVSGEIDKVEGRMRFLQSRAAMSTITVSLLPKPKQEPLKQVETPPPPPPPHTLALPIDWLSSVGIDRLLQLN